jgi:hypothetical protein
MEDESWVYFGEGDCFVTGEKVWSLTEIFVSNFKKLYLDSFGREPEEEEFYDAIDFIWGKEDEEIPY